ncbi:MAG: STAS-like domain-containing protein [Desulfosalsimonas sp.]
MKEHITIRVADIIGSPLCISAEDGQKVYEKLVPLLEQDRKVTISFERVTTIISLFLNTAIGQLYGVFEEDRLNALLSVTGLTDDDLEMLKRVVDNAKKYYANPQSFDQAWVSEGSDEE